MEVNENFENFDSILKFIQSNSADYFLQKNEDLANKLREFNPVLTLIENEEIKGILGMKVDFESKFAELFGPICSNENFLQYANKLWKYCLHKNQGKISKYQFLCAKEDQDKIEFAKANNFVQKNYDVFFEFQLDKEYFFQDEFDRVSALKQMEFEDFAQLHDEVFPDTFVNGIELVNSLSDFRKVFIYKENEEIVGYVFIEILEGTNEAKIEFIAVKESYRNQKIGTALFNYLYFILKNEYLISTLKLDVNSANKKAISLYRKLGWNQKNSDDLLCYKIQFT